jgi:hypothetical protein
MNKIIAYECSFCSLFLKDKFIIEGHETGCKLHSKFQQHKLKEQNIARDYLDTFRKRIRTISQLFELIEDEMNDICKAIGFLEYYRKDMKIRPITNITYKHTGFLSPDNIGDVYTSHSAPIGSQTYIEGKRGEKYAKGFDIEVFYEHVKKEQIDREVNILDYIAGINTGSGGSWSPGRHYYCTFFIEDFPLGIREL